ncbi:uncharacterized protein LOC110426295 [Herrania umbratica]|uniref:Uncharacterized protein LOC110426295 n=1 Tax=Herrania umbratica TaxID=108875 RepID=A0A6J1BCR6_9ROSI|nr:uncharacterized protein LOC110426295 [Herrania umbratica]
MTFRLLNAPSSSPISLSLRLPSSPKPRRASSASAPRTIPATDFVIDFGKHKGKMLGTLPSNYLKWMSKNLRARDYEHWANLADQVLQDPVYQDRIEWEFAENVLHGNNAKLTTNDSFLSGNQSAVSMLLEISERFGWDNEDKAGWRKVNFEVLGTSKGGRIPRVADMNDGESKSGREGKEVKPGDGVLGEKRRERRERVRLKTEVKLEIKQKSGDSFGHGVDGGVRLDRSQGSDKDRTVEIYNPFPGREALLKKVRNNRRRFL